MTRNDSLTLFNNNTSSNENDHLILPAAGTTAYTYIMSSPKKTKEQECLEVMRALLFAGRRVLDLDIHSLAASELPLMTEGDLTNIETSLTEPKQPESTDTDTAGERLSAASSPNTESNTPSESPTSNNPVVSTSSNSEAPVSDPEAATSNIQASTENPQTSTSNDLGTSTSTAPGSAHQASTPIEQPSPAVTPLSNEPLDLSSGESSNKKPRLSDILSDDSSNNSADGRDQSHQKDDLLDDG